MRTSLEPKLPLQRRAQMVRRSGARVAVSAGPLNEPLGVDSVVDVLSVDTEASDPITRTASLDQALVVLFTSRSTGQPKGVSLSHRGPVNYAAQMSKAWQLEAGNRLLQFASLGFDASLEEMLCAWTVGASLYVRDESLLEPGRLPDACGRDDVTVMGLPTAYFHQVVDAVEATEASWPPRVRLVVIGGEKASTEKLDRFRALSKRPARLVNTYGPTEGSISVTQCEVTDLLEREGRSWVGSPLGVVVPNARVYVLESRADAGSDWRSRRALHRRGRAGARLRGSTARDCRTIRPRRGQRRLRSAALPYRGRGALGPGRDVGVSRPPRRTGQDPRVSNQTGRDRSGPLGPA